MAQERRNLPDSITVQRHGSRCGKTGFVGYFLRKLTTPSKFARNFGDLQREGFSGTAIFSA